MTHRRLRSRACRALTIALVLLPACHDPVARGLSPGQLQRAIKQKVSGIVGGTVAVRCQGVDAFNYDLPLWPGETTRCVVTNGFQRGTVDVIIHETTDGAVRAEVTRPRP